MKAAQIIKLWRALWEYLNGRKRKIATIAGIVVAWAWKYEVAPEMWLDLATGLLTGFGILANVHAEMKDRAVRVARKAMQAGAP